jgi:hypothetical protein
MAYKLFTVIACCYSVKTEGEDNSTLVLLSALAAMFQVPTIIFQLFIQYFVFFVRNRLWLKHCSFWTHRDDTLILPISNLASQDVKSLLSSWYAYQLVKTGHGLNLLSIFFPLRYAISQCGRSIHWKSLELTSIRCNSSSLVFGHGLSS